MPVSPHSYGETRSRIGRIPRLASLVNVAGQGAKERPIACLKQGATAVPTPKVVF